MASFKLRDWFFEITASATNRRGTRLRSGDRPSQETMENLVHSATMRSVADDRAKEDSGTTTLEELNGHVVAATDAQAKANQAKKTDRTLVVQPSQLPTVTTAGTIIVASPNIPLEETDVLQDEIEVADTTKNIFIVSMTETFKNWFQTVATFVDNFYAAFQQHLLDFGALSTQVSQNTADIAALSPGGPPAVVPVGAVFMWETATPPAEYLLLDGQEVDQATYPALFLHYGTTYNTGGETPGFFRLPDRRQESPRGYLSGGLIDGVADVLGESRGSDTVFLNSNNIPSHNHGITNLTTSTDGSHSHPATITKATGATNNGLMRQGGTDVGQSAIVTIGSAGNHSHTVSGTTDFNSTTSQAVQITNPVFLANYIVKAL